MAYTDFDLRTAIQRFGLTVEEDTDLFADVMPIEPSEFLRVWSSDLARIALRVNSEKARSEFIIAPILVEAQRRSGTDVQVLPGITFAVDPAQGLTGSCDYLLARSREAYFVSAPILAVVEAKREDVVGGLGQCTAEMVAIQIFNEREGKPLPAVHGCVTSGSIWRFLRLMGKMLYIDRPEYYLRDEAKIIGILVSIARGCGVAGAA
jgi:hypothetical protein